MELLQGILVTFMMQQYWDLQIGVSSQQRLQWVGIDNSGNGWGVVQSLLANTVESPSCSWDVWNGERNPNSLLLKCRLHEWGTSCFLQFSQYSASIPGCSDWAELQSCSAYDPFQVRCCTHLIVPQNPYLSLPHIDSKYFYYDDA